MKYYRVFGYRGAMPEGYGLQVAIDSDGDIVGYRFTVSAIRGSVDSNINFAIYSAWNHYIERLYIRKDCAPGASIDAARAVVRERDALKSAASAMLPCGYSVYSVNSIMRATPTFTFSVGAFTSKEYPFFEIAVMHAIKHSMRPMSPADLIARLDAVEAKVK